MAETSPKQKPPIARFLPLILIMAGAVIGWFLLRDILSFETLRDNREALLAFRDMHYLAMAAAFMAIYVLIVAFSLPGAAIATLTGGFLFGLFPGALFIIISATTGATIIFLAARWGLGDRLVARMDSSSGLTKRIKEGIAENEWSMLFLIRLVPVVPFFVANLLPALVGVRLDRYVLTTFFGIMPGSIVYTWVGAGLGQVFAMGETPDLSIIFEPAILGPILGLCALAMLPIILKTIRGRKGL
ncbi:TVP38/TMEM64 family protein [Rhodophyticola sp. CCM32]|uniref:TVP38/TMEM64 family protein n=1 Tax=Rhodophyticola sp. CCM32 TaxID=2916397 RepID=UPI00107F3579|nr:VTT domain-containing protein [Rhodophyticola sp. CCM32]QBY01419.1 TVP38/TMEM64 family protein [Rhodophyticola sp. CCM32]